MSVGRSTVRTDRARTTFLEQLAETCNVSHSARVAGMSRNAAYSWRADDAEFERDWDEAIEQAVDKLEKVAWDRASKEDGGSDRMLEILLKAHRPEKYREKQALELTGKNGGPIETANAHLELTIDMSAEQAAEAYAKLIGAKK